MDEVSFKKSQILNTIYKNTDSEFERFLLDQEETGYSYEFLEEVRAMIPEISSNRAELIIKVLLKTSGKLNTRSLQNMLMLPAGALAEHMVIELFDIIAPKERFKFFSDLIINADLDSLPSIAKIINKLELAYGRLAANGERREIKRIITLEELLQLESILTKTAKQLLKGNGLFDFNNWRMVYHLLESFDTNYAKSYMKIVLKDDVNIAKYLTSCVSAWVGGITEYEVENSYQAYLTKERVLQAIGSLKESGQLFSLSEEIQRKCGAFFLYSSQKASYIEHIPQSDIDALLDSWHE